MMISDDELTKKYKDCRYGRLVVLGFSRRKSNYHMYLCKCDCGEQKEVWIYDLIRRIRSCGCLRSDRNKELSTTHNMYKSDEYTIWQSIKNRSTNENNKRAKDYIGRGIGICKRWLKFENFYKDMGDRPSKNHSIDRIENDKGYYRENCRWALPKEQGRNRRSNKMISYKGSTKTIAEWVEITGINDNTFRGRLLKNYNIEDVFFTGNLKFKELSNDA